MQSLQQQLQRALHRALERHSQRLDLAAERLQRPRQSLLAQQHRLAALDARLGAALRARVSQAGERARALEARWRRAGVVTMDARNFRLQSMATRLEALNPRSVLRRGYAWVARPDGQPVVRVEDLQPGDAFDAVLHDGQVRAVVESVRPDPCSS